MRKYLILILTITAVIGCDNRNADQESIEKQETIFDWDAANVYFLLTDRFYNGDASNDTIIKREQETATLRGFEGGDFAGITQKLKEGYFTDLGINAIWLTPIFEQVQGGVDEGTGYTYAYHGYWARDWTAVEPSYGTLEEFEQLVQTAHDLDIRILLDIVINHTGPVTEQDSQWPDDWVRTGPVCTYQDQETAMTCTLTNNLPDIRTDSDTPVELPTFLIEKWKEEGRYQQEITELDEFFQASGLARTPANYLIKWVTDYARETGVDGFRIDTVKHVEEDVWTTFVEQSRIAYKQWKENHPEQVFHDDEFFIVGELYGYYAAGGREYGFSDVSVDYFDSGYDAMINFGFKEHAQTDYQGLFEMYDRMKDSLQTQKVSDPVSFMNYLSSHDDGQPFDPLRDKTMEAGTKLLLASGISQIYYGDETARMLQADGATGDANLRTNMNWDNIDQETLEHYQLLGTFRRDHPAVGAGNHINLAHQGAGTLAARFYRRDHGDDTVIIGAGLTDGMLKIDVSKVFDNASQIRNSYTGKLLDVENGSVEATVTNGVVLLESVP
jgi:alpha-amylase